MPIDRRSFLKLTQAAALGPVLVKQAGAAEPELPAFHADTRTNAGGMQYWFLGNGKLIAALQTVQKAGVGTHCGLILLSPAHIAPKHSSLLYNEYGGLSSSRLFVEIDTVRVGPDLHATLHWEYPSSVPTIVIEWEAGDYRVREEIWCPARTSALVRTVTVKNAGASPGNVLAGMYLGANQDYFDEHSYDAANGIATATGYHRLQVFAFARSALRLKDVIVDFGRLDPGQSDAATLGIALDEEAKEILKRGVDALKAESAEYWLSKATITTDSLLISHLFRTSQSGFRAIVGNNGKMNGGPFQYAGEWVRDSSMSAMGATLAGLPEVGGAILERLVAEKVDDEGRASETGTYWPDETVELDQNGELLYAVRQHWVWTGDDRLIKKQWPRLRNAAEFVLRPAFRDEDPGLLKSAREFWERMPIHGFTPAYELAYQVWNIVGLRAAAEMAAHAGDAASQERWLQFAERLRKATFEHPKFALIDEGRLLKRRLVTGEPQHIVVPPDRTKLAEGMPLRLERSPRCNPDATLAFPIIFGLVEPTGEIANRTLAALETLWNQRWPGGGYGRYDVTSEPDSPGPWPFASMFIARAYLENGDSEKVWRVLRWLGDVQGGASGAWFEFYGERPIPPLPRIGVIPWAWAEMQMLIVTQILGVRPGPTELLVRPRLLAGMKHVEARLPFNGHFLSLALTAGADKPKARLDGKKLTAEEGQVRIPRITRDATLEMWL